MHVSLKPLLLCALCCALTAICAQIQIPLPMVPINLSLFAVCFTGALLGAKYAAMSMLAYLLLGAVGVPVFAGMMGGLGVLFGKTGGYLVGYVACALLTGYLCDHMKAGFFRRCIAMGTGILVCYVFGTLWFMLVTGLDLWSSLLYCVLPFLLGDVLKIALAAYLTGRMAQIVNIP